MTCVQSMMMIHLECWDLILYLLIKLSYINKIQIDNLITHRSHIFFTFVHTNSEFLADVQSFSLLFTLFNVRAYVITWRERRFLIGCLRSKRGGQSRSFSARIQWFCWDRTVTFDWYPRYLHKAYNKFLSKYIIDYSKSLKSSLRRLLWTKLHVTKFICITLTLSWSCNFFIFFLNYTLVNLFIPKWNDNSFFI